MIVMISQKLRVPVVVGGVVLMAALSACSSPMSALGNGDQEAFCTVLKEQADPAAVSKNLSKAGSLSGAEDWEQYFDEADARTEALTKIAPRELRDDISAMQEANDIMRAAYEDADYDLTRIDPTAMNEAQAKLKPASQSVAAYGRETCGITYPTSLGG